MQYKSIIQMTFKKLGFEPRQSQIETVNSVLQQFIKNNKKYVVLSAPTGSGKSIIAVVISQCLKLLTIGENQGLKTSYILMHNKALQHQYYNTFKDKDDFINIMGASNYECKEMNGTGQDCVIKGVHLQNLQFIRPNCKRCEYRLTRSLLRKKQHVISNYSYYFIMSLTKKRLEQRILTVYDESHMINDIFCNHMQIKISPRVINALITLIDKYPINQTDYLSNQLQECKLQLQNNKVNQSNYLDFFEVYYVIINKIIEKYVQAVDDLKQSGDKQTYKAYNRVLSKLSNIGYKYESLIEFEYQYVVDFNQGISLQPVFIGRVFEKSITSKYCLFMSATNQKEYIVETLDLPIKEVGFIKAKPVFDPKSKQVNFLNHTGYNYKNMSDLKILEQMNGIICDILEQHYEQSGVILTPSFKISQSVYKHLTRRLLPINILCQKQGEPLAPLLDEFINSVKPSLLISPSLWQGISLDDHTSRYQIIIKAPYLNLGQKRIKYILDNYPEIYKIQTLFRLIQGLGRSTRNKNDYSVSYCLDSNCQTLFNSHYNVWDDQFKVYSM